MLISFVTWHHLQKIPVKCTTYFIFKVQTFWFYVNPIQFIQVQNFPKNPLFLIIIWNSSIPSRIPYFTLLFFPFWAQKSSFFPTQIVDTPQALLYKMLLFLVPISIPLENLSTKFHIIFIHYAARENRKISATTEKTFVDCIFTVIYCDKFSSSSAVFTILRCDKIFMRVEKRKLFNLWKGVEGKWNLCGCEQRWSSKKSLWIFNKKFPCSSEQKH